MHKKMKLKLCFGLNLKIKQNILKLVSVRLYLCILYYFTSKFLTNTQTNYYINYYLFKNGGKIEDTR